MRVLLGLSALASLVVVQGQTLTLGFSGAAPTIATPVQNSLGAAAAVSVYSNSATAQAGNLINNIPNFTNTMSSTAYITNTGQWGFQVTNAVTTMLFEVTTNTYTAQLQYRWSGYSGGSVNYLCDPCTVSQVGYQQTSGSATSGCNLNPQTAGGLGGYYCASFTRTYLMGGLTVGQNAVNSFGITVWDTNVFPGPNNVAISFSFIRAAPTVIVGDPQIVGMQGQDFQVHGMPDEIFNIVTYPTIQVNARFTYLESAECHDNYTACFAHPGTYISEEGFRVGKDKIRVTAGSFKKGLSVSVNGKKIKSNVDLKSGAVELINHRRVVVHTDIMKFTITNSDKFLNQEIDLKDDKLVALGAERRQLRDNERFHPEVPLHGLQGQTWRNVEYASGLDYEGSIMDYHVVDGNLYGTDFVFNQFQA